MASSRPTLAEIQQRVKTDLSVRVTGSATPLKRSVIVVLSTVMAGVAHLIYGYIEWLSRQIFGDTAEDENLERIASLEEITKTPATFAAGNYTFSGTVGAVIPAATLLKRADGVEYKTNLELTLPGATGTVGITCTTAGQIGNEGVSGALSLLSPIAGVQTEGVVATGGIVGGTDEETVKALRARYLEVKREPPHGGSETDYKIWAKEIPGVTRVWVYGGVAYLGAGTVGVAFVRDNDESLIPSAQEVAAVQAHLKVKAPVTAIVTAFAPVAQVLNFTIDLNPDTTAIRAAVEAELRDLILREAIPGGTLKLTHIREAISIAAGEEDHILTAPNADVTRAFGQITTMGVITWV